MIILDVEAVDQRTKVPIGIEGEVSADELDRLRQGDRAFGASLVKRPLQIELQHRQGCAQTFEEGICVRIVEQQQNVLE